MSKAIVIGAGMGGLATALRLRRKGYEVQVFEANDYPGGKNHSFRMGAYRFDAGPSLFTMPWLVDQLFELFGKNPKDYFDYDQKEVVCNYFWEDGTTFSAKADMKTFIRDAAETFQTAPAKIESYLQNNQKKYDLTAPIFLEKSLHKTKSYLSKDTLKALLAISKMHLNDNLDQTNKRYFSNPHLIQLFNRYATYNGSSPYKTPGIMSMIPHLEMKLGTYFPTGGMDTIPKSLYQLAKEEGVTFHFKEAVESIDYYKKKAIGVITKGGGYEADVIVSNMDIFSSYKKLLPDLSHPNRTLRQERSSSALIFYWGIKKTFPRLDLHNILFSDDYEGEFKAIFDNQALHPDPTVYIHVSSKENQFDAPIDGENWFVMINAPGNYGQDWRHLKTIARTQIVQKINRVLGVDIEQYIEQEAVLDPVGIERKTSSYRGALYGAASNSKFAAFLRHPNFSSQLKNLYFCGGSVHPGGGIPLCLLSAKIVSDLIPES